MKLLIRSFLVFLPIREMIKEGKTKKEIMKQFIRPNHHENFEFIGMDDLMKEKLFTALPKDGMESKPTQWVAEDF